MYQDQREGDGKFHKCGMIVPNRTERSQIRYSHGLYNFAQSRGYSEMPVSGIRWYCKSSVSRLETGVPKSRSIDYVMVKGLTGQPGLSQEMVPI